MLRALKIRHSSQPTAATDGDESLADDCVHDVEPTNNTNNGRGHDRKRTSIPSPKIPEDDLVDRGSSIGLPGEDIFPRVLFTAYMVLICLPVLSGFAFLAHLIITHDMLEYLFNHLLLMLNLGTGLVCLVPIYKFLQALIFEERISRHMFWFSVTTWPLIFVLLVRVYDELGIQAQKRSISDPYIDGNVLSAWKTGAWPQTFVGCEDRVEPQQSDLFSEAIYRTQFTRIEGQQPNNIQPRFDRELFLSTHNNQTLCSQGFAANEDLYGLGIRTGIYLQWVTALLVNNLLPDSHREAQRVYLVFSISLCIATYVMSFVSGSCVFGIEIEVLYWLYWGGVVCVFASSPSQTRLGAKTAKWIGLDWDTAIQYTTNIMMIYHGIWFIWWAYDQVFARMPCGTYQFFVAPLLDPSPTFNFVRDFLTQLISPVALPLLFAIPYMTYLLAAEIQNSIRDSTICQQLFPNWSKSLLSLFIRGLGNCHLWNKKVYRFLRRVTNLPVRARGGIRLITPIDVAHRRAYRIRCIILGVTSCAMSITAIECLLSWNKVVNIYNIRSTGQYIALTMGLAGFVQACWQLVNQEARRRRDLTRRQLIGQDIELDQFPLSMSGALRAAFSQPDIGFLTNDGALPPPVTAAVSRTSTRSSLESIRRFSIGSLESVDVSHLRAADNEDEYTMTGAL
ncbi:hypothetical protein V8F06_007464 [Rhypophila decipiens]